MGVLNDNTRLGASAAGAYEIGRSLRFNAADSTSLSFTPSSAGNLKRWTVSLWTKRTKLGAFQPIWGTGTAATGSTWGGFYWDASDKLYLFDAATSMQKESAANFRDTNAWYHIVVAVDAANTIAKAWVNGTEVVWDSQNTNPSNADGKAMAATAHYIGNDSSSYDMDGYIAEVHTCDGLYLDHEDFGKTDPITGAWVAKAYGGSHGTQGSYLNFSDNSDTTSGTLGADSSANSNDWTPTNFSVASGEGKDSVTDTPTNNYCTWNYLDYIWGGFSGHMADDRLRNGNLSTSGGDGKNAFMKGSFYVSSGKWYYEAKGVGHGGDKIGWARSEDVNGSEGSGSDHTTHHAYLSGNGEFQSNATTATPYGGTTYGGSIADGDVIGCAIDMDNNTVAWHKAGQWGDGSGNWDETYDNANKISISNKNWAPAYLDSSHTSGGDMHANFGQQGFAHTPPTGFKALCTANMPEPTIKKWDEHFAITTYTGNATDDRSIAVGFQPDLTILKQRDYTKNWYWYDSIRGANQQFVTNGTAASAEYTDRMQAFESNGIQIGASSEINNNASTYVNYSWKAGSSATNGDGSISATVRANPTAGFSIVQYDVHSGAGNFTVGHGLGVAPELILAKNQDTDSNWDVFSKDIPNTHRLKLNSDAAIEDQPAWGDTSPTSSVFTSLGNGAWHAVGNTMINYCFASVTGYSKIDYYVSQGGSGMSGEFVWTGFRPGFVMIKRKDGTGPWNIFDSAREPYNLVHKNLRWNTSGQEDSGRDIDFLSNGFKVKDSGSEINDNDDVYIYMAIAETSFKYTTAR